MLIITRKRGESFIIDENIKVTYLGTNRNAQCKFGIEAPREISVHREEVQERINKKIPKKN
jgi:carbon storage regulator